MNAPQECESPLAGGPIAEQKSGSEAIVDGADAEHKRYEAARAMAADLAGIALHKVVGTGGEPAYIACKWNLTRELHTLDDVENWLDRVTGDAGRRERKRRAVIDAANRRQDQLDEAADLFRGPGGSSP